LHIQKSTSFHEKDIEIASILAEQTGVFFALNDLISRREYEALIDPLTGVWNRRYMIQRLEQEDDRLLRYGDCASVAILDMSDFKLINDRFGHVVGDEVLVATAQMIQANIRKSDFVGRYGGDEFIIFMPNTTHEAASAQMERIAESITQLRVSDRKFLISADYGVASSPNDESSLMGAIRVADERMYFYKRERKRSLLSEI